MYESIIIIEFIRLKGASQAAFKMTVKGVTRLENALTAPNN